VQFNRLDPYLLLALLNTPIVRQQMRAKQFTRDIIDTIGKRLFEIFLPIPKEKNLQVFISRKTREVIETRVGLLKQSQEISLSVEGIENPMVELLETLKEL